MNDVPVGAFKSVKLVEGVPERAPLTYIACCAALNVIAEYIVGSVATEYVDGITFAADENAAEYDESLNPIVVDPVPGITRENREFAAYATPTCAGATHNVFAS